MNKNIIELLDASLNQKDEQKAIVGERGPRSNDPADKIFLDLNSSAKGRNILRLIETAIEYIGKEVLHQGEEIKLSWSHIETYLKTWVPNGYDLHGIIDFTFRSVMSKIDPVNSKGLCHIIFKGAHEQIALAYVDFLRPILLIRNIEYPKIVNGDVVLMEEQFFFCRHFVLDKNGKIVLQDPHNLLNNDMLLKTLRADIFDFSFQFILGIIPSENGTRHLQNLRPGNRKPYVVTPLGTVEARLHKKSTHTPEEKAGFSQVQSCTLIDKQLLSPAFGFSKSRNAKLYGLMTDSRDALITRLMVNDGGTVSRLFDYDSHESAQKSWSYSGYNADKKQKRIFSKNELDDFKVRNIEVRAESTSTNELLARLRFNPYRSVVSICTDTLESRLLAYDFAQELLEQFASYAEKMGTTFDPNFQLPIIFYVAQSVRGHDIKLYTDEMRQIDQAEALAIYSDIDRRNDKYNANNYEFLLGLTAITLEVLLEPVVCKWSTPLKVPLALAMLRNGNVRMLMRLLRLGKKSQPDLREELVEFIVKNKLVKQNDLAITGLIVDEQFDIANTFIAETQSVINKLPSDDRCINSTLVDHFREKGNPRQIKYTGLEQTWLQDPIKNWVPITLFIKEHPELPRTFLGELLRIACITKEHNAAKFLLDNGAPMNANNTPADGSGCIALISMAAMEKDWEMVTLFCKYKSDADDSLEFGFALFLAISDGQLNLAKVLLQAGAKATWRNNSHYAIEYRLRSTLSLALERGFDELLPQLIEYEKTSTDIHAVFRSEQALKLALEKGNHVAVELIQGNFGTITLTSVDQNTNIFQQVLEAFITGGRVLANKVLLNYCRTYQLLPNDNELTAYPREWLIKLLQHRFNVKDSEHIVKGLRLILSFFRHAQLQNRCVEILIDFVLKNSVESLQPQENFPTQGWLTLLSSDEVGKIVISGILENLPQQVRDTLKTENRIKNTTDTMTITPISMVAKAKEWELVRRIIDYPTDAEDKSEYGYALYEALQNGLVALARLLLAAGAKPTWRSNNQYYEYQFVSTLWVAIDLGLNELLPELIEHEKEYHDEYSLIRIENALEHANEKNNHEAIQILQEKLGPITLFDDTNIIPSICRRVLVVMRIAGEANAKERLLKYLQQYQLLPNDNDQMAPVQEWRAKLFQHHISHYLFMKDDFCEVLKLLMPSISPLEIKARCTSALIDWALKKPDLSALIANVSSLTDQDTLKSIGSSVIHDFARSLNNNSWEVLKRIDKDESDRKGITPISSAAMENEWAFVRQFTEHPTDIDDKCEYGYALWAALNAGQEELAELLIRAGAKPIWRNNVIHTLEDKLKSTPWAALNCGSNKLLPQLIDYEINFLDAYTMLRFEHTLERAYEKDNHEAIRLIQEKVGPITLIDPTNSAASICRRVLILLSIEGQPLAEKRLLTYCRQYHFLPDEKELTTHAQLWVAGLFQRQFLAKNACLVVEGLRKIMPHLCTVLISFPTADFQKMALKKMVRWIMYYKEPTLFGLMTAISNIEDYDTRHYFAQIVINTLLRFHPIDVSLIREIIRLNFSTGFGQEIWKITLDSRCNKIRTRVNWGNKSDDEALLLFEIYPMIPEDLLSRIYDCAIHRLQHKITRAVITRPDLSQKTKRKILSFALSHNLSDKVDRMIPLMMSLNFPVTVKHLSKVSQYSTKNLIFLLIDHIDQVEYSTPEKLWECVKILMPTFPTDFKLEKKLIALLGPSMIRHIVLIFWLMDYHSEKNCPNLSRFYNDNELGKKLFTSGLIAKYKERNNTDEAILSALNTYFSDNNIFPKEDILIETYSIILDHIEFAPKPGQAKSAGFFSKILPDLTKLGPYNANSALSDYLKERQDNAHRLYSYMQELDQLLRKYEETLENNEVNTQLLLRASSPSSIFSQ